MNLLFEIDKKDYDPDATPVVDEAARAIIIRENKISLIYSTNKKYYKLPGGGIEPGENPVEAMIREVKEEVGLVVIPETVQDYGYVRRIHRGKYEPLFIQDNYYYICETEPEQTAPDYTENEKREGFGPVWIGIAEAIAVNEAYMRENPEDAMIEREVRVLKMVMERIGQ